MFGRILLTISALSFCACPVLAGTTTYGNSYMYTAPGGGSPAPMGDSVASTVFDLDATVATSYGGSGQTWSNYEGTPADSSGQTAYDMYLGATSSATTDDPAFTGTAGSASAYFLIDNADGSNDEFSLKGSVTSFIQAMHKQGTGETNWWLAFTFRYKDDGALQYLFGTTSGGSRPYLEISISNTDKINVRQWPASGSVLITSTGGLTDGNDYLVVVTRDSAADDTLIYISSATEESFLTNTWTTNTTNGTDMIFSRIPGSGYGAVGTRWYGVSGGNAFIGDTEFNAICDEYELRHARTYC